MARTLIMGGVLGLICGVIFNALYFGAGQLSTPMAYVHGVSGTILGVLIAAIIFLYRKANTTK